MGGALKTLQFLKELYLKEYVTVCVHHVRTKLAYFSICLRKVHFCAVCMVQLLFKCL